MLVYNIYNDLVKGVDRQLKTDRKENKTMLKKKLLPYNLQFFAAEAEESEEKGNENGAKEEESENKEDEKTFTQSEVNRLMAKEKKEGKKSVLKSLGFNSEKEAQDAFNLLKALTDSQKTEEEKAKEKEIEGKVSKEIEDAEQRAMMAEAKLSCLTNGVGKDSIDDVLAIALPKVTDDEDLESVIQKMKKEKRYSSFFESNGSSDGTGNPPGHSGNSKGSKSTNWEYGKRIAESNKKDNKQKQSYFN